jgi:hypothetical protein
MSGKQIINAVFAFLLLIIACVIIYRIEGMGGLEAFLR